jgi:hypothetical protein
MDWQNIGPGEYEVLARVLRAVANSPTPVRYGFGENTLSPAIRQQYLPFMDFSFGMPEHALLELLASQINQYGLPPDSPYMDLPVNAGRFMYATDLRRAAQAARTPRFIQGR